MFALEESPSENPVTQLGSRGLLEAFSTIGNSTGTILGKYFFNTRSATVSPLLSNAFILFFFIKKKEGERSIP